MLLCSFSPGLPLPVFCPSLPLLYSSVIFPTFSFPPFITFPISFHPNLPLFQIFPFFLLHSPLLLPSFLFLFLFLFFPIISFLTHLFPPLLFPLFLPISLTPLLCSLFSYPTTVTHFPSKMGIFDRMVDSSQTTLVQ